MQRPLDNLSRKCKELDVITCLICLKFVLTLMSELLFVSNAFSIDQSWGEIKDNGQVSDFLEQLEQFVHSLSTAKDNMDGRVELSESDSLEGLLDTLKSPSDYLAAGKTHHGTLVEK